MSRGIANWPPGVLPMREPRATLHESWKVTMRWSLLLLVEVQRTAADQLVGQLADVRRLLVAMSSWFCSSTANGHQPPAPMPTSVFQKL